MFRKEPAHRRGVHRPPTVTRAVAAGSSLLLGLGIAMAQPMLASADTGTASRAEGRFLSGSIAGVDLADLVAVEPAVARNNGRQGTQEVRDPLVVSVLDTRAVDLTGALRVDPSAAGIGADASGGALSQYARAESDGEAVGASGTVGAGGAIGPDATGKTNGPLVIRFDQAIGTDFLDAATDLRLEIQAIAARAAGTPRSVSGDYYIDGATLRFTSPALADVTTSVAEALAPIDARIEALGGRNGPLALDIARLLGALSPVLAPTGSSLDLSVVVDSDLAGAVTPILTQTYGGGGVTFDLSTGEVALDLEALAGGDLNDKPVGYEVLSDATVTRVVSSVLSQLDEIVGQIERRAEQALRAAKVDIDADAAVLTEQAPILGQVCASDDAGAGLGGVLGGVLDGVLGGAGGSLGGLVCTPQTTLLPPLRTSAAIDVHGTVQQILDGTATASAAASVLGVPVSVDLPGLLGDLDTTLIGSLFDGRGVLGGLAGVLRSTVLDPATDAMLGGSSVDALLSDLLSIRVNLQDTRIGGGGGFAVAPGTEFTQTAMRVSVAGGTGGSLATLDIAAGSVAPNGAAVPGGPDGPGGPGDPGSPDGPGSPLTPTATGRLAFTGIGIAALVAVVVALLAAGAYLVHESRRRSRPTTGPVD